MTDFHTSLLTAFLLGLGSSGHCFGMCGGIACALGLQQQASPRIAVLLYNLGRLGAYATIAWLFGGILQLATASMPSLVPWLRTLAACLLLAMALHTLQWWRGILVLENLGRVLWQPLQGLGQRWIPTTGWSKPLALGFLWGWLPCALVYSTLAWAVTQGSHGQAVLLMLCFGAGTLPVMLVSAMTARQMRSLLQQTGWRYGMACLLVVCAAWTLQSAWLHANHAPGTDNSQGQAHHHHH